MLPEALRNVVMRDYHEKSGHFGRDKVLKAIRQKYWWPRMRIDVEKWVASCHECQQRSPPPRPKLGKLQNIPTSYPWQRVHMDIVGPLPVTLNGNKYILNLVDGYTKYAVGYAMRDMKAETVGKILFYHFVHCFETPEEIVSDRGRNLNASTIIQEGLQLFGIKPKMTTAYHPQGNGMVERVNGTVIEVLSKLVSLNQKDWDDKLPIAIGAYNRAIHSSTGTSPYYLNHGRDPRYPIDIELGLPRRELGVPVTEFRVRLTEGLQAAMKAVNVRLEEARRRQKKGVPCGTRGCSSSSQATWC